MSTEQELEALKAANLPRLDTFYGVSIEGIRVCGTDDAYYVDAIEFCAKNPDICNHILTHREKNAGVSHELPAFVVVGMAIHEHEKRQQQTA